MFCKSNGFGVHGVDGYAISVEVDISDGLPSFILIGRLSEEVREAQERIRTAFKNAGFRLPPRRITVNLSPAGVRKEGTACDLAIAAAVLCCLQKEAGREMPEKEIRDQWGFVGELGLDGQIKGVSGILPRVYAAKKAGMKRVFLSRENVAEGAAVEGIEIVGTENLKELGRLFQNPGAIRGTYFSREAFEGVQAEFEEDFEELIGLPTVRRACEAAAAGWHNILFIGPAGTGKTMAARRLATILPPLSLEESMEVSGVYSICGLLNSQAPLLKTRPFRSPHHSITPWAMAGGGKNPRPGEISLASRGILFLDELAEFRPEVLDLLRQPMEEGKITVSRLSGSVTFPASALVAAAMNPCKCGELFSEGESACRCTPQQIARYLGRVSGPFLDRIDIGVDVPRQNPAFLRETGPGESSAVMRARVAEAIDRQRERFAGEEICCNSQMKRRHLERFCRLSPGDEKFLEQAEKSQGISLRGHGKVLKAARTLADLDGEKEIGRTQLAEAVGLRGFMQKYWGRIGTLL